MRASNALPSAGSLLAARLDVVAHDATRMSRATTIRERIASTGKREAMRGTNDDARNGRRVAKRKGSDRRLPALDLPSAYLHRQLQYARSPATPHSREPRCRSLDSLRSLGMTDAVAHPRTSSSPHYP